MIGSTELERLIERLIAKGGMSLRQIILMFMVIEEPVRPAQA